MKLHKSYFIISESLQQSWWWVACPTKTLMVVITCGQIDRKKKPSGLCNWFYILTQYNTTWMILHLVFLPDKTHNIFKWTVTKRQRVNIWCYLLKAQIRVRTSVYPLVFQGVGPLEMLQRFPVLRPPTLVPSYTEWPSALTTNTDAQINKYSACNQIGSEKLE